MSKVKLSTHINDDDNVIQYPFESLFGIGDEVAINFGYAGHFGACTVTGVHFTRNKVKFDVEISVVHQGTDEKGVTRLYNIDSDFVVSRQEWLDWNQSRKSFGTEYYNEQMPLSQSTDVHAREAFDANTPPPKEEGEDYSVDVLVDLNGNREHFIIGHYDYQEKKWYFHGDDSVLELEHMRWMYLPLAKYDKVG
jgi:hypothetical protein